MSSFRRVQSKSSSAAAKDDVTQKQLNVDINANGDKQNKIGIVSVNRSGVKPWVNSGLGIVSSGHKQLDELLGGGYALGTVVLFEVDSYSHYGDTLMLYGVAEGISHMHQTLFVVENALEVKNICKSIPYNQTLAKKEDDTDENNIPDSDAVKNEESIKDQMSHLSIAWQYGKYIKANADQETSRVQHDMNSTTRSFCCSYDLSRSMTSQPYLLSSACTYLNHSAIDSCRREHPEATASEILSLLFTDIISFLDRSMTSSCSAIRIFIPHVENLFSLFDIDNAYDQQIPTAEQTRIIAAFLLKLKHAIRERQVIVILSHRVEASSTSFSCKVRQIADTVLSLESFAGKRHTVPYEFNEFCGFLVFRKIQSYGALAPFRPSGSRFGLKRDRRKLHIEPLHLPPEESRAFGTAGNASQQQPSGPTAQDSDIVDRKHISLDHSSDHTAVRIDKSTSHQNSSVISISPDVDNTTKFKTPLAASIAALKAARQAAAAEKSTGPISISSVGDKRSAPLQPGAACNPRAASNQKYDF